MVRTSENPSMKNRTLELRLSPDSSNIHPTDPNPKRRLQRILYSALLLMVCYSSGGCSTLIEASVSAIGGKRESYYDRIWRENDEISRRNQDY